MSIFKRIEVWILLVLTAAGLVFVLLSDDNDRDDYGGTPGKTDPVKPAKRVDNPPPAKTSAEFEEGGPVEVESVKLEREPSGDYFCIVQFEFSNQSQSPVHTIRSAGLVTKSDKRIPIFFLAFDGAPPILPPQESTKTSLRFSLKPEDVVGDLTLEIAGARAPVKSSRSFDPESIARSGSRTFTNLDW